MAQKGIAAEQIRTDIIAETVARVMKAIDGFEEKSKFTTWAWSIYSRALAEYFRNSCRQMPHLMTSLESLRDEHGVELPDERPLDTIAPLLLNALKKIAANPEDPDYEKALFLVDFYELTMQGKNQIEMAGILGMKSNSFNQRLKRCRNALKKRLKEFMQ